MIRRAQWKRRAKTCGDLLKGLPDLASNKPVIGLWELSRQIQNNPQLLKLFQQNDGVEVWNAVQQQSRFSGFHASFLQHLDDSGFRCSGELMLTVASFQENPAALMKPSSPSTLPSIGCLSGVSS